ncbi:MFS transporter [Microvirga rosea]|uniref:MFS transporter n=1 Tax=Microvirga rosea TaxID=2715425 RepID=UPI001D0A66DE|nr:MFS transporter [Microvirga rosea]MCB8822226.1 MFS transporter [Microvirga rosea]
MDLGADYSEPRALSRGQAALAVTLCLGEGIYALNSFLVSTSLPSAVIELGGVGLISWAFTVYLVAAIVGGAAAGFLKQKIGSRAVLVMPAIVFLIGTLFAGFAPSMVVVLVGRTLQGLGEGIIAAACYALVAELFPPRLVPKFFGLLAITWAGCAFGGPLLAGFVTETWSWRIAFLMNVPLILIFLGLVFGIIPATRMAPKAMALPIGRLVGIACGIMLVAVASLQAEAWRSAALVIAAVIVLVAVFLFDRNRHERLFPSDAFQLTSTVGAGLWVALLMPLAQASTSVYLPLAIQRLWGYGPTAAGAISAVMALSWSTAAFLVASVTRSPFPTLLIRGGPVLLTLGLSGAAVAIVWEQAALLVAAQIAIGCGFGVNWAFLSQAIMKAARPGEQDIASGLVPTTQSAGYAIGAATAGLVAQFSGFTGDLASQAFAPAMAMVFTVGAVIAMGAVLASLKVRHDVHLPAR